MVLFLIPSEGTDSFTMKYVSCRVLGDVLYQAEEAPSYSQFAGSVHVEWILDFDKCSFSFDHDYYFYAKLVIAKFIDCFGPCGF